MFATLDEKEAAKIERRRKLEEERKARIFSDKVRTKGVAEFDHKS